MIAYDPKHALRILLDLPKSPVFQTLLVEMLAAGAYAALIVWLDHGIWKGHATLGPAVLSVLGIILGLLLVFRTNTAYDRWWEGRRLWGQLVNVSRALAHALDAMLPAGAPARATAADQLADYPAALMAHLRAAPGSGGVSPSPPVAIIGDLSRTVHRAVQGGELPREAIVALTPMLAAFDDVCGACERIRKTPIPYSYSSYVKQFVLLYALLVPFALARDLGYGTVAASMAIFFATMGLELLAMEIEEPFGTDPNDLPLEDISATIARDTRAILTPSS
jgi:putative membrane protein